MNLSINPILGKINIENTDRCKILRCIYHFNHPFSTYCLIRIFDFNSKIIVIASQLKGAILWDEFLIAKVSKNFKLVHNNVHWINHIGLFSDVVSNEDKFFHTTFFYKKNHIFSRKEIELDKETEINIEMVKNLIESSLEPVESWLGLDLLAANNFKRENEKTSFSLLHHYIQENLENLCDQKDIQKILSKSQPGAIFFYPNQDKELEFIEHAEILDNNDNFGKKVSTYIEKSCPDEEIVICTCIDNYEPFCTIVLKETFLNPVKVNFAPIDELVEYEIESTEIVEFNVSQYRKEIRVREERLQRLLRLYLDPNMDYLKSTIKKQDPGYLRGALFYYPEHNNSSFLFKEQLNSSYQKPAIPYVNAYNIETEIVICFSIFRKLSVCGIFPK